MGMLLLRACALLGWLVVRSLCRVSVYNIPASSPLGALDGRRVVAGPGEALEGSRDPLVGFVSAAQIVDDSALSAVLYAYIEGCLRSGGRGRLVLLLSAGRLLGLEALGAVLQDKIADIVASCTGNTQRIVTLLDASALTPEQIESVRELAAAAPGKSSAAAPKAPAPLDPSRVGAGEVEAACEVRGLVQGYLARAHTRMQTLSNPTLAVLVGKVAEAMREDAAELEDLATYRSTSALRQASRECRAALASVVEGYHRRLIGAYLTASKNNFDKSMLRVTPDKAVKRKLLKLADAVLGKFTASAEALRTGLLEALEKEIFGIPGKVGSKTAFAYAAEQRALEAYLSRAREDRVAALFLLGAYNPFVRTYPFPPLHVNLNYLVDPRAVAFGLQYDRLYDEQVEGVVPDRADGMVLPGVAQVVFHPNRQPVSREYKPWWQTIQDFYYEEEEPATETAK